MSQKTYHIGILGCANIATRSVIPAFYRHPRFKVAAIASRNIQKASPIANQYSCKGYGSYDELLSDKEIDLVYIPLPTGLHYEWVMKALHARKHVLCEKSLGVSLNEVKEMVNFANANHLLLMENFQFRFHPQTQWVIDYVLSGELGDLRCFRSQFGFPPFKDLNNIRYEKQLGGGALLDAGAYTLKSMSVILSMETFSLRGASKIVPQYSEVDLYGGAFLESTNGIIAELAYGFDHYYQCGFEIWGSRGKLISTRAYTAPANLKPVIIVETASAGRNEFVLPAADHFALMVDHVATKLDNQDFDEEYRQDLLQASYIQQINDYCNGI